jgi:hypothetical protein
MQHPRRLVGLAGFGSQPVADQEAISNARTVLARRHGSRRRRLAAIGNAILSKHRTDAVGGSDLSHNRARRPKCGLPPGNRDAAPRARVINGKVHFMQFCNGGDQGKP